MSEKITITPKGLVEMGVVPIREEAENIVFATSRDEKYIKDLDKLLWNRRSDFPFGDIYIDYSPVSTPGIIGRYYLVVTNPSPELVKSIEPSPEGPVYYTHLNDKRPEDINLLINDLRKKGKNIKQIAEQLGVKPLDIEIWRYYIEETERFHKEIEEEAKELRKKLK